MNNNDADQLYDRLTVLQLMQVYRGHRHGVCMNVLGMWT